MSTMIKQKITGPDGWKTVALAPVANIQLVGPPNRYAIAIGANPPAADDFGMPVTALDGSWATSALEETDNVYIRTFGAGVDSDPTITGLLN